VRTAPSRTRLRRRLSPARKLVLAAEVLAVYLRARWLLWRHDLPRAVGELRSQYADGGAPSADDRAAAERLSRAVSRTLRLLPTDSRCLVRSLVLTALLARRGLPGVLVIGVRPGEDFAAHAWVELEGRALLPTGDEQFGRLAEL
jgi:hypothetical protein